MARIEETDAQIIGDYLGDCRHDPETLAYFLKRAKAAPCVRIVVASVENLINR